MMFININKLLSRYNYYSRIYIYIYIYAFIFSYVNHVSQFRPLGSEYFLWATKQITSGTVQQSRYSKHKILHLRTFVFGHNLNLYFTFYLKLQIFVCLMKVLSPGNIVSEMNAFQMLALGCLWFICPSI
jgi:hypothetical protein